MGKPINVEGDMIKNSRFVSVNMSGTTFEDVNLSECTFKNVNLGKCSFHDISFGNTIITGACFDGCEIPHGNIGDLRIAGVRAEDLLAAYKQVHGELPPTPHPERTEWEHH